MCTLMVFRNQRRRTLFGISEEEQQSIPLVCIIGCTFFVRFHELPHLLEPVPNLILYTHLAT
jgi:hypothetical protein